MDEIADWRKEWPDVLVRISESGYLTYKSKVLNASVDIWLNEYFNTYAPLSLKSLKKDYEKMVKEKPKLESMDADALISYIYLHERGLVNELMPEWA